MAKKDFIFAEILSIYNSEDFIMLSGSGLEGIINISSG